MNKETLDPRMALPKGIVVGEKYEICEPLGRGGFAISYRATELGVMRDVVLKELFPTGSSRDASGRVTLPGTEIENERSIEALINEAALMSSLQFPGVLRVFGAFRGFGTAYYVTEFLPDSVTLRDLLDTKGRLSVREVVALLRSASQALDSIHSAGYLHRDINPSNILVRHSEAYLIDFGSARTWAPNAAKRHTALFTPGYAPIEQLAETGEWGPSLDIYSLCATMYEALTGAAPTPAVDRVGGVALRAVSSLRAEVAPWVSNCIEKGLALHKQDRPQSIGALLKLLDEAVVLAPIEDGKQHNEIDRMDRTAVALKAFRIKPGICPSCGMGLERPRRPLAGVCPVCREGKVALRNINDRLCAVCRIDLLEKVSQFPKLSFCPICSVGMLQKRSVMSRLWKCGQCDAEFERRGKTLALMNFGQTSNELITVGEAKEESSFWQQISGRSETVWTCSGCGAQFDEVSSDEWLLVHAMHDPFGMLNGTRRLAPWEWARIAHRLPIDCGNAECTACKADFFLDSSSLTLLDVASDPYHFARNRLGQKLPLDEVAWMAAGKPSGRPGVICTECAFELDEDGDYWRLCFANDYRLAAYQGEAHAYEDWHRLAEQLPPIGGEADFFTELIETLKLSVLRGDTAWADGEGDCRWVGPVSQFPGKEPERRPQAVGSVRLTHERMDLKLGRNAKKVPFDALLRIEEVGELVEVMLKGEREAIYLRVDPVKLEIELDSGNYVVKLSQHDFVSLVDLLRGQPSELSHEMVRRVRNLN